jgi:hypothetical protein
MSPVGRSVEEVVGTTIASDLAPRQRDEVQAFIDENDGRYADGVAETARRVSIEEAAGKFDAAVPVLLARLRQGQHRRRHLQAVRSELDIVTFAERRFKAKLADFAKHGADPLFWGEQEAIEYAVDWTIIDRKDCAMSQAELEDALRERLGLPHPDRTVVPPPPELLAKMALLAGGTVTPTVRAAPEPDDDDDDDDDAPIVARP